MCGVAAVSIGVILLGGDLEGAEWKVVLSAIAVAVFSLAGLAAIAAFGREPRWMGPAGLALAGLGLVVWEAYVWFGGPDSDSMLRIAMVAALLSASVTHANLLLADPDRDDPAAGLLAATLVVNGGLTGVLVVGILIDSFLGSEIFPKVFGVLAVLLGLGTLVVPVMRRIRADGAESAAAGYETFTSAQGAGWLELSYRGQTVLFEVEHDEGDSAEPTIRAWTFDGNEERPIPLDQRRAGRRCPYRHGPGSPADHPRNRRSPELTRSPIDYPRVILVIETGGVRDWPSLGAVWMARTMSMPAMTWPKAAKPCPSTLRRPPKSSSG